MALLWSDRLWSSATRVVLSSFECILCQNAWNEWKCTKAKIQLFKVFFFFSPPQPAAELDQFCIDRHICWRVHGRMRSGLRSSNLFTPPRTPKIAAGEKIRCVRSSEVDATFTKQCLLSAIDSFGLDGRIGSQWLARQLAGYWCIFRFLDVLSLSFFFLDSRVSGRFSCEEMEQQLQQLSSSYGL